MAQKLIVSEKGELTIHADNGIIDSKGKHEVKLEGEFVINAPDLLRLLSRVNEAPLMEKHKYNWGDTTIIYSFNKDCIIDDMQKTIDEMQKVSDCNRQSLYSKIEGLETELSELKSRGLLKRIFCKN